VPLPALASFGEGTAVAAVIALGAVSRWVFSTSARERRMAEERARRDFGLLVPALTTADPRAAARSRSALEAHGVRATLASAPPPGAGEPVRVTADGFVVRPQQSAAGVHVLVFPHDLERARAILAAAPPA